MFGQHALQLQRTWPENLASGPFSPSSRNPLHTQRSNDQLGASRVCPDQIKTGFTDKSGKEEVLTEYFCDWPDCTNVAVEVVGFSRDIGVFAAVCEEHAASIKSDKEPPRKQQ